MLQGWAAVYFGAGLSVFYGIWKGVELYDKPSQQPFVRLLSQSLLLASTKHSGMLLEDRETLCVQRTIHAC